MKSTCKWVAIGAEDRLLEGTFRNETAERGSRKKCGTTIHLSTHMRRLGKGGEATAGCHQGSHWPHLTRLDEAR